MSILRLTRRAEADLADIANFTLESWGEQQAERYIDDLETCCKRLAGNPALGRKCDHIRDGLRRMEHGQHVVFYTQKPEGILILRILHKRMLPERRVIGR